MKNPNGYGTVFKLKGNRRRPFVARKTKGFNEKGHPQYITIGYFAKRAEALKALANFNSNPLLADFTELTFIELYENWKEKEWEKISLSTQIKTKSMIKHLEPLFNIKFKEIKFYHIEEVINNCPCKNKKYLKTIISRLEDLALKYEIIDKKVINLIKLTTEPSAERKIFTLEERQKLWDNQNYPYVDYVLILIYSGWRISELLNLKKSNIDLKEGIMSGGMKTRAGKNRIIPIHPLIINLIKKRIETQREYPFKIDYSTFWHHFQKIMGYLQMNHIVHETRHTFRSMLDSAGGNKICIDLIMGHSIQGGIGEKIYTHKTIEELKETILLITR